MQYSVFIVIWILLFVSPLIKAQDNGRCELYLYLNDINMKKSFQENRTFYLANLMSDTVNSRNNEIKIKSNGRYELFCITKALDSQIHRIALNDNLNRRKFLNQELRTYIDLNNEQFYAFFTDLMINPQDFNFTSFTIECAYYDPIICSRFYKFIISDNEEYDTGLNSIFSFKRRENYIVLCWIIGVTTFLAILTIGIRTACRSELGLSRLGKMKCWDSRSNKNPIVKYEAPPIFKKHNQSANTSNFNRNSAKRTSLSKKNSYKEIRSFSTPAHYNANQNDVEIPITVESKRGFI